MDVTSFKEEQLQIIKCDGDAVTTRNVPRSSCEWASRPSRASPTNRGGDHGGRRSSIYPCRFSSRHRCPDGCTVPGKPTDSIEVQICHTIIEDISSLASKVLRESHSFGVFSDSCARYDTAQMNKNSTRKEGSILLK
jgi:hypothetical protein